MSLFRRILAARRSLVMLIVAVIVLTGCSGLAGESASDEAENEGERSVESAERLTSTISDVEPEDEEATAESVAPPVRLARVSESDSVLAVIENHDDLTKFAALIAEHPQRSVFTQARGLTLLVPSDSAFDAGLADFDVLAADPDAFTLFLSHHMTVGAIDATAMTASGAFTNAMNQTLSVADGPDGSGPTVAGAAVIEADLEAGNGYVHIIDRPVPINIP